MMRAAPRILVIRESHQIAEGLARLLEREELHASVVMSCQDGLQRLADLSPSIVIVDSSTSTPPGGPTAFERLLDVLNHQGIACLVLRKDGAFAQTPIPEWVQALDYAVILCDPRDNLIEEFAVSGVETICDMPDDAVKARADAGTAIVALTHDPRIDDMGLMEALKTDAFYVGAMGSTRTSASRRTRLLALDVTAAELDRLHAPIGLPIGSKTPPEIAIAILAEITAVRKGCERAARARLEQINAAA